MNAAADSPSTILITKHNTMKGVPKGALSNSPNNTVLKPDTNSPISQRKTDDTEATILPNRGEVMAITNSYIPNTKPYCVGVAPELSIIADLIKIS